MTCARMTPPAGSSSSSCCSTRFFHRKRSAVSCAAARTHTQGTHAAHRVEASAARPSLSQLLSEQAGAALARRAACRPGRATRNLPGEEPRRAPAPVHLARLEQQPANQGLTPCRDHHTAPRRPTHLVRLEQAGKVPAQQHGVRAGEELHGVHGGAPGAHRPHLAQQLLQLGLVLRLARRVVQRLRPRRPRCDKGGGNTGLPDQCARGEAPVRGTQ